MSDYYWRPNYPIYPCGYDPNLDPQYYIKAADYRMRMPGAPRLFPTVGIYVEEVFKPVPERFPDVLVGDFGTIYSLHTGMKQNPIPFPGGYLGVRTFDTDICATRQVGIHRLVLMAHCFVPNHRELQGNHKDGNKRNNHLSNLEWVTAQENMIHASATNLIKHKYPEQMIRDICERLTVGMTPEQVAYDLGLEFTNEIKCLINTIRYRTGYKRITKDYPDMPGALHPRTNNGRRYTEEQIRRVCELLTQYKTAMAVYEVYKRKYNDEVSYTVIKALKSRNPINASYRAWKDIVDQYNF